MPNVCRRRAATALLLGAAMCVAAEEGLAPMSGAGGVFRDAERRALTPAPVREPSAVPKALPPPKANAESADPAARRVIGPISKIRIHGSTAFAERERVAEGILAALGDGDKTVGDVADAIAGVKKALLKKGFYLVRITVARVRTYDRATGELALVVDEGRFGELTLTFAGEEEGTWFSREQILRRFEGVAEGDTFDYGKLRRALFDVNSHPDLTIDTKVDVRRPVEGEGAERHVARYADLTLDVRESMPFHFVWEANNYGLKDVNEWQTSLTAQYLNLTKHDDVLTITPAMSMGAELYSCAASYMLPHHWWLGGNTTVYGGWSRVDIDDIVPSLDLEGSGYFVGLQHSENLLNDDRRLLALSGGLLWRYIEDRYTVSSRRLNERGSDILPISLALSYTGKEADGLGGRNFATVEGVFNLMNGRDDLDKMWTGADANYWILRWQVARLQPLFGWWDSSRSESLHNWQLFSKVEGQYTGDTLIPTEKLMLGGYNCLRGYRTRGYVGDFGVYGTEEIRTPILVDTAASCFGDRTDKKAFDRLQLTAFCDWGWVVYNDLPSGYDDDEFLVSGGVGLRLAVTQHAQVRCDLAMPIVHGNNDEPRDAKAYLGAQMQF